MPSSSRPSSFSSVQVARQALADRLREIREAAELTSKELAEAAGWHQTKVSKLEHLVTSPSAEDIRVWCRLCGAGDQIDDLIASARAVNSAYMEWRRRQRSGLKQAQESYIPLWERTTRFRIYEPAVVPGVLQTGGYIAALMRTIITFNRIPDDLDDAVQARLKRQNLMHEGTRTFAVLIEEQALRTRHGDAAIMAGQLGHLLTAMTWPNVSLGIIPVSAERSGMWQLNGFWIYDSDRVITELLTAEVTITQPGEVDIYARAFTALAEMAVYGDQARALILAALADLH